MYKVCLLVDELLVMEKVSLLTLLTNIEPIFLWKEDAKRVLKMLKGQIRNERRFDFAVNSGAQYRIPLHITPTDALAMLSRR